MFQVLLRIGKKWRHECTHYPIFFMILRYVILWYYDFDYVFWNSYVDGVWLYENGFCISFYKLKYFTMISGSLRFYSISVTSKRPFMDSIDRFIMFKSILNGLIMILSMISKVLISSIIFCFWFIRDLYVCYGRVFWVCLNIGYMISRLDFMSMIFGFYFCV